MVQAPCQSYCPVSDVQYKNRSTLLMELNTVLKVIKCCSLDDPDKAHRGGFIVAATKSENPIARNPAAPHVIPMLQHIFGRFCGASMNSGTQHPL
jgi:hypothetical protein